MIESYLRANNMFVDYNEVGKFQVFFWGQIFYLSLTVFCVNCSLRKKKYTHPT